MKLDSLHQLYVHELKDMYNGEQQILKALPKMAKNASSPELRAAFEEHLEQTRGHVDRLEQIFQKLDEPAKGQKCKGIEGIITEGEDVMEDEDAPPASLVIAETEAALKTMTVSMAVMELDLTESQTIVFRNAAHGHLSVVYRRPDGNIGWIDPERTKSLNGH